MKDPEGKLQAEIIQYLQSRKIYAFSVPNEGKGRSVVAQMQLIAMGLKSGVSDLVVVLPGKVIFMEVKTPEGKQSSQQEKFEQIVKDLDHDYHVVRSVDDVKNLFPE
jgi:hypothetical protein